MGRVKEAKTKKTTKEIISSIFEWIFIGLAAGLFLFILVFASDKPGKGSSGSLFGFETRLVLSDSMNGEDSYYEGKDYKIESFAAGDVVFISDCDYENEKKYNKFYDNLKEGDIVLYYSNYFNEYITHRIVELEEVKDASGNIIDISYVVHGDAVDENYQEKYSNMSYETLLKSDNLITGKVVGSSSFVGWIYTTLFSHKILLYVIVMVPCVIGIVIETSKIIKEVNSSKLAKVEQVQQAKDDEIELLKKELEKLKQGKKEEDEK